LVGQFLVALICSFNCPIFGLKRLQIGGKEQIGYLHRCSNNGGIIFGRKRQPLIHSFIKSFNGFQISPNWINYIHFASIDVGKLDQKLIFLIRFLYFPFTICILIQRMMMWQIWFHSFFLNLDLIESKRRN